MVPLDHVTRLVSRLMGLVCMVLAILLAGLSSVLRVLQIAQSLWPNSPLYPKQVCRTTPINRPVPDIPPPDQWPIVPCQYDPAPGVVGGLVNLAPALALSWALLSVALCFSSLARGDMWSRRVTARFRNFALGGLIYISTAPFVDTITNTVLHLIRPNRIDRVLTNGGDFFVTISGQATTISMSRVMVLVYAITVAIIAVLISRASTMAEDHQQIV